MHLKSFVCWLALLALPVLADCPWADLTGDCFVDLADFAVIARQWPDSQSYLYPVTNQWLTGVWLPEDMVVLPFGSFERGNAWEGDADEQPARWVSMDSFAIGKYEITNGQYCDFLKSAYPSQLRVVNGIVYDVGDYGYRFPYCDTSASSPYSQIVFLNDVFSVRTKSGRDMTRDPMILVTWYGAAAYCNWRSEREGRDICYELGSWNCDFTKNGYRLPTEAEWEYAARGGLERKRFPWGDTISQSQANFYSDNYEYDLSPVKYAYHPLWNDGQYPYTSPVGFFDGNLKYKSDYHWPGSATSYQTASGANGYGLYDMAGNAWEWCQDWYGSYSLSLGLQINPTGPATGTLRILRGGSCLHESVFSNDQVSYENVYYCRVSNRARFAPDSRQAAGFGFRLACFQTEKLIVPDVTNLDRWDAEAVLGGAGLTVGNVWEEFSPFTPGSVIYQNPDPGTRVSFGSPVDLFVSKGLEELP